MSDTVPKTHRLTLAATVACAVVTFRLAEAILGTAWAGLLFSPYTWTARLYTFGQIVVPALSVAVAVLVSRWAERRLSVCTVKARWVALLIFLMFVAFPARVKVQLVPVEASPEDSGLREESPTIR